MSESESVIQNLQVMFDIEKFYQFIKIFIACNSFNWNEIFICYSTPSSILKFQSITNSYVNCRYIYF